MDYTYLLYIAIILIFTKAFGLLSKVIKLPQVVGALVAGIILGPVCLNLVSLDNAPILSNLSEIGVIVLPAGCFRRCYPYRNIGKYHCRNAQGTRKAQHKSG